METPDEVSPVPVAPLAVWRRVLGGVTVAGLWAAVGVCVLMLMRPRVVVEVVGDRTTIGLSPEMLPRELWALGAAVACGVAAWFVVGGRSLGGLGLVVAVLLPVVAWHQNAARVVLTPDTLTAPTEGRLLPGAPATVRFDQVAAILLARRGSSSKLQRCQMKDGRQVLFDVGPLIDDAGPLIEANARNRGARVSWLP